LHPLELLDTCFGRRKSLRHRAAQFADRLAYLASDFEVGLIRSLFSAYFVASEFFLGLGGAEEICCQFGAAHVVKDFWLLFKALRE